MSKQPYASRRELAGQPFVHRMLTHRLADLEADRGLILEMHCLGAYHSNPPWFRGDSFTVYQAAWLKTSQPTGFLESLFAHQQNGTGVAEIWEEDGRQVGFLQLSFYEIEGYGIGVVDINDIEVIPAEQRRGVGTKMLQHAEEIALQRGATLLRSETGSWNEASQGLHARLGFGVFRLQFEKRLRFGSG